MWCLINHGIEPTRVVEIKNQQTMGKKKQDRRKQKEPPEPLLIVIPRDNPLTQMILGGPTREQRMAEYLKTHKTLPPPWPWPSEERGRERSDNDSSDRDDNKRQEIVADSSSCSSEKMVLEPSEDLEPSNMLADTATIQPIVASQNADNSSPIRCSGSPKDLAILQQLTNVDASIAQMNASITQLLVVKAYLTAQLPAGVQVETASPPPSAPMQPVTTVHGPVAAMQPVPLVQQPEQAQPQPSADTGHAASAPLPPVQSPSSTRPPKQPRWTPRPSPRAHVLRGCRSGRGRGCGCSSCGVRAPDIMEGGSTPRPPRGGGGCTFQLRVDLSRQA
jgi:hypothetical protein